MSKLRILSPAQQFGVMEQFTVLHTTEKSQIAVMVLAEGETSGEFGTDHPHADQVLIVLEGAGQIRCEDETRNLHVGDVAVVPAGARHQVIGPNRTLNVYAPVAYPDEA